MVSQAVLHVVFHDEMAMPRLSATFEVVTPVRSSRFLTEPGRGDDRSRNSHQVGRLPGLQTRFRAQLPSQPHQFAGTPIKSGSVAQAACVTAHGLLHGRNDRPIDQARLSMILRGTAPNRLLVLQVHGDSAGKN
jgi:hypothetical protein